MTHRKPANQSDAYLIALEHYLMENMGVSGDAAHDALQKAYKKGLQGQDAIAFAKKVLGGGGGTNDIPTIPGVDGTTSSSSGGSSSGGGSTGPDPAVLRANYIELLRRWGLSPKDAGLDNLVEHAIDATWTTSQFMQAVRKTKAYSQQFAGIQWRQGMTEGQYLQQFAAYKGMAQDFGRKLTTEQFGLLLKKGVDSREWSFRLKAFDSLNKNKALLDWYERVLKARGELKPKESLSVKERFKAITKQDSQKFESVYQEAYLSFQLANAGITIGKSDKKDFSRGEILKLIKEVESSTPGFEVESLGAKDFAGLAASIQQSMPLSRLYKAGITKRDLVELQFGTKRAPEIAKKVEALLAQGKAATEDKANAQFVQTGEKTTKLLYGGLGGSAGE